MRSLFLGGPIGGRFMDAEGRRFHDVPVWRDEGGCTTCTYLRVLVVAIDDVAIYVPSDVERPEEFALGELVRRAWDAETLRSNLERHHRGLGGMTCDACGALLFPEEES